MNKFIFISFLFLSTDLILAADKLNTTPSPDCSSIIKNLESIAIQQNHCNKSTDCIVLTWPENSYECFRFANKTSNLNTYSKPLKEAQRLCPILYECVSEPTELECVKNKCVGKY